MEGMPSDSERIREDAPGAAPIIARRAALAAAGEARWMQCCPDIKNITHPSEYLTAEEKEEFHSLGLRLRSKSQEEARADILRKRQARLAAIPSLS